MNRNLFTAYKSNISEDRDSLGVLKDEDGNKNLYFRAVNPTEVKLSILSDDIIGPNEFLLRNPRPRQPLVLTRKISILLSTGDEDIWDHPDRHSDDIGIFFFFLNNFKINKAIYQEVMI